jgi:hypothetical protein
MRFQKYFRRLSWAEKHDLAIRAKTGVIYLYHLASEKKRPSLGMAEKIRDATNNAVRLQDWASR